MDKNSPQGKGVRTGMQAAVGAVVAFFAGLWAIPGVEEYVEAQGPLTILAILGSLGIASGLISFFQNRLGK